MGLQKVAFNFMIERGGKLVKSLICSKPQNITSSISSKPPIYKHKYDFELKNLIKKFDEDLPFAYKRSVAESMLQDEIKIWGKVLDHNIENAGLKSIGMNPINMDFEETFTKMLKQRKKGKYIGMFLGQGDFTPNVVVNKYLRTGKIAHKDWNIERIDEIIESANKEMEHIKLPHDTVLYRYAMDTSHIPNVGETFIEKGFISTSINKLSASKYGGKQIKIYARKGTGCIPNMNDLEILLKENSNFKVLYNDGFHIELLLL